MTYEGGGAEDKYQESRRMKAPCSLKTDSRKTPLSAEQVTFGRELETVSSTYRVHVSPGSIGGGTSNHV